MIGSAKFSEDRCYRYWLLRSFDDCEIRSLGLHGTLAIIGLNPSTADAEKNDPTVSRCISWTRRLGYARLLMLNMYAWRGTDPRELWRANKNLVDIVGGPPNFRISLEEYCQRFEAKRIIAAWGNEKLERHRMFYAADWRLDCFKKNQDGSPAHPLYLPYSLTPKPWNYQRNPGTISLAMSNNWTHPICETCWKNRTFLPALKSGQGGHVTRQLRIAHRLITPSVLVCCFCGESQRSEIFVHQDPATVPCAGNHPEAKC